MKKLLAMVMVCTMSAALLAGCGAAKETAEAPATETADATEDVAEDTVSEETATDTTTAQDTLIVGTNAAFPPFEYVGDDGNPDGFDVALIKAIGEKIGMNVEVQDMEFASLVSSIGSKIDLAIAGMTVTDERKEMVDFSEPYYTAVQYVLIPKDSTISSAEDLKGKNIGVQLGTTGDFIAADIEGANVSQYDKAVDAVNDMNNGRTDCVIIDKNPALVFQEKFADTVVALDGTQFAFEPEDYAIAMPKGDTELADKVNTALAELKEDGTFDALVKEYIEEN